jgi:hypothetical protein
MSNRILSIIDYSYKMVTSITIHHPIPIEEEYVDTVISDLIETYNRYRVVIIDEGVVDIINSSGRHDLIINLVDNEDHGYIREYGILYIIKVKRLQNVSIPFKYDEDDVKQTIIYQLIYKYNHKLFMYPSSSYDSGSFKKYFSRFIGRDDLDKLINIWNTMIDEIEDDDIKKWCFDNSIDYYYLPIMPLVKVELSDDIRSKLIGMSRKVMYYNDYYIDEKGNIYKLDRPIVSNIDRIRPVRLWVIRSEDNKIILALRDEV